MDINNLFLTLLLFIKSNTNSFTALLNDVDDLILAGNDTEEIT